MVASLGLELVDQLTATRWRSLKLYNGYRILIALMFSAEQGMFRDQNWHTYLGESLIPTLVFAYLVFSVLAALFTWLESPDIDLLLPAQIIIDVAFIVLLMFAQGDNQGSIGLLLIISVASASLISEGRYALFYASIATIGILLGQTFSSLLSGSLPSSYTPSVLLSLGCFATAWLAYSLAKRIQQSELLASQRGVDIKNMAQINALIAHEMQDGVLVVDKSMNVQQHNLQAENLLGITANEEASAEQKPLQTLSPEIADMMQEWQNADSSNGNYTKKLNAFSRELQLRFLQISDSRQDGALIFIEDWSQLQTQAHQVKLAALGRLTANIAHEIRNPLSAISHANQLLQEDEEMPQASKRMLQIISDNVQRLDQIIKDVLELNRRDRTNQESISLESFVHEFYMQFCAVEKIPTTHFTLKSCDSNPTIIFDRRHLNQILWNLCKNGWRHCKQVENSLKLVVNNVNKKPSLQIEIIDDGEGIPEELQSHLFEPFFTTEKSGTGLGLYITSELSDANGANLKFNSSSKGTKFTLEIKKA